MAVVIAILYRSGSTFLDLFLGIGQHGEKDIGCGEGERGLDKRVTLTGSTNEIARGFAFELDNEAAAA
jgi:hypothetical protein